MSYVPLIAPSTTDARIKFLASIADSFIYVVSKMGTTGATASVSTSLNSLLVRIRSLLPSPIPLAVGFGVSTQAHFEEVGQNADGVVIGSQLVSVIRTAESKQEDTVAAIQAYCAHVSGGKPRSEHVASTDAPAAAIVTGVNDKAGMKALPPRFGDFGGAYVPEALFDCLAELSSAYSNARADPEFWKEWEGEFGYMNRPSKLYEATRLSEHAGGAKIWFKREDLNHTGSHKVRRAVPVQDRADGVIDQQRDRTGPPCPSHWKEKNHCRDGSWSARSRDRDCVRQVWPRVCGLHGRGGRASSGAQRVPNEDARRQGCLGHLGNAHPQGCHQCVPPPPFWIWIGLTQTLKMKRCATG